jgi:hypothetical protein
MAHRPKADSEIFNKFVPASSGKQEVYDMRMSEEFIEWATCVVLLGSSLLIVAFS